MPNTYPTSPAPSFSSRYTTERRTLITIFEDGSEQRRQKWTSAKTHFELVYNALSQTDVETIRTFYDSTSEGALTSFSFTNLMESTTPSYTCRFEEEGGLTIERIAPNIYRVETRFVEVF